jgi:AcrR family transcriptional regulator
VIVTPWGRSDELRARRLRPGPGTSREEVEANQRERLFGAMVAAVAEHGYEKTRVADLLELSGISRNTFYKHFDNKQDCFLATMDAVLNVSGEWILATYRNHDGPWDERLAVAVETLTRSIAAAPAVARLYYVESYAAGPEALAKLDQTAEDLTDLAMQALGQSSEHAGMPRDLVRAILHGIRRVIQTRVRTGHEAELVEDGPDLLRWALSYRPPPRPLRRPKAPPGSIALPPRDGQDPRERILTAVIELMAEKGYQALTITDLAQRAAVSLTTFYDRFDGKEDVVVAALRRSSSRLFEATAPVYEAEPDWPHAIGAAMHAFFALLASERPFAQFGGVDVHSGSRLVVDVRDRLLRAGQALIAEGYRERPGATRIAGEAIAASIDALVFHHLTRKGAEHIYELAPRAVYLTLVPFVGPDEACTIANEAGESALLR